VSRATVRRVLVTVLVHPRLWPVALYAARHLAVPRWWRRWPPLPLPDPGYWEFRMVTAYGRPDDGPLSAPDVVAYLRWCQRMRESLR